jgi:hypothetical protein
MRQIVSFVIFISIVLFYSCEPAATFDEPQPADIKSLTAFPKRIQGKFLADDQASILTITDKLITRYYDFHFKEHKDSLNSSYKLIGDTLVNVTDSTKEKVILRGDSIIQHYNATDTLFSISKDNILKKFKGYYFLNNLYNENTWGVSKLSLEKGVLSIASISNKEDIQKLKEITETSGDTTSTSFSPTRRQFKSFLRQEGFGKKETFTRMKENGR